jgi:transaldolase
VINLLQLLHQYGQSVWLDGFEHGWISRGELQRYIEEEGLTAARSNFQSLQAAIERHEYDRDFTTLAQQGISQTAQSDYDYLIVRDLQLAADLLKQVHSQTQGRNGYVQIDLPPDTLFETETAIAAAQKIWQSVGWSNLLLGIPATPLLLPVIEQLISDRINVNATFVFSPTGYDQVFNRYLAGLERLVRQGESVSEVVCSVSVSIGRLNEMTDPQIANAEASFNMMQARLLYQHYRILRHSERWRSLPEGAKPLRLVWDCIVRWTQSTGQK